MEQPLDLRRSLRALRRRWWIVAGLVSVAVAGGVSATVLKGPTFEARAGVLLPPASYDANGRSLRNVITERRIASSAAILGPAGQALSPPVPASRLIKRVRVGTVGSDILEVAAQAPSGREAVALANAVAKEYVNFSENATADQANTSITLLKDTAAALQTQIEKLGADIAAGSARLGALATGSPEAVQQAALIDSQRAAQVDATRQLSTINSRVADARLNAELTRRGLRILEPATTPNPAWRRQAVKRIGIAGLVGLLGGVILAIYLGHWDRRLRSRDEVAQAAGLPVLASLAVRPPKRVDHWRDLLQRWTPSASERLVLRQAFIKLRYLSVQTPTNLTVVTLPGDVAALAVAVKLAAYSADVGISTGVVITIRDRAAARLRSACVVASTSRAGARPNLWTLDGTHDVEALDVKAGGSADLTVTVATVEEDMLSLPSWRSPTTTVLAVSSGFATSDTIAATVLACADREHPITGIVLANPETEDHTTGTLGLSGGTTVGAGPVSSETSVSSLEARAGTKPSTRAKKTVAQRHSVPEEPPKTAARSRKEAAPLTRPGEFRALSLPTVKPVTSDLDL